MATNYTVNYEDERFKTVQSEKKDALKEVNDTYSGMIDNADSYYDKMIAESEKYAEKQKQFQQEQTDFAIEKIEQQKEQAKKDYTKEQSGAYVDWQKQSNQYGANAEQIAAQGMANSGFSESSQVSMYNTYQNRVATAREVYNRAVLNYDNAINEAKIQNNAALAEIAYNALQQQLELSLAGFQYKNSLVMAQADKKFEVDNAYYNRWRDVLGQINTENALAEEVRQFDKGYALQEKEYEEGVRQFNEELALQKAKLDEEKRQDNLTIEKEEESDGGGGGGESKKYSPGGVIKQTYGNTSSVKETKLQTAINSNQRMDVSDSDSEAPIDMNSVLKLGYGPISAAKLDDLVAKGLVMKYEQGGKTKFRHSDYVLKHNTLFGK